MLLVNSNYSTFDPVNLPLVPLVKFESGPTNFNKMFWAAILCVLYYRRVLSRANLYVLHFCSGYTSSSSGKSEESQ